MRPRHPRAAAIAAGASRPLSATPPQTRAAMLMGRRLQLSSLLASPFMQTAPRCRAALARLPRRAAAPEFQAPAGPFSQQADMREHPERQIAPGLQPPPETLPGNRPAASALLRPHRSPHARQSTNL